MTTPGLDRWSRLQSQPFGRNTATNPDAYGGTTGSQIRRLGEDYNQATRLLRRQARRGDANSALNLIKLREEATAQGIQTGGIRKHDEYNAGILGRVQAMERGSIDREKAVEANRLQAEEAMVEGKTTPAAVPQAPVEPPPVATDAVAARMRSGLSGMATTGAGLLGARPAGLTPLPPVGMNPTIPTEAPINPVTPTRTPLSRAQTPGASRGADWIRRPTWWEQYRKI